jgi:hypothetical protein
VRTTLALAVLILPAWARAQSAPPPADVASAGAAPHGPWEGSITPPFFDVNKYRADPGNPGAIRVPGTNVAIFIGGFAQVDAIADANVIGNPDQFVVSSIPVGGGTGNTGSQLSARQSRVFVETDAPWSVARLLAYVEVDFFDPQNQADLHIRHAFGAIGEPDGVRFVGGQTWTTFMDATILPSQLDYAGPVGIANVLAPQARLIVPLDRRADATTGVAYGFEWTTSLEAPDPQISLPMGTQATGFSYWPDLATALRWDHGHGHLLVSGVFRQLGVVPASGSRSSVVGYGGAVTGRLTGFWGKDQVLWSAGGGRGVAAYFAGSKGQDLDAFLEPSGSLSAPTLVAAYGSVQHFLWRDRFAVTGIYSILRLFDLDAGTDATLRQLQYVGGVLQLFPNRRFMAGVEYLFGERGNRSGQTGWDNRVQVSTQVQF